MSDVEALRPPEYLSPSSIFTFQQCPLKFRYTRIDGLLDPPGIDAVRGSYVHEILESLYRLPAEERTSTTAQSIARSLWPKWSEEAQDFLRTPQQERTFRWEVWWAVENLFKLEDPTVVKCDGIEEYVEAPIDGVKIRGYIDRWAYGDNGIVICDYKTGKTPRPQYREDKFQQLFIYAMLLEIIKDTAAERVELLYLKHGDRLVGIPSQINLNKTRELIQNTAEQIQNNCETGHFEAKPSILCDWCNFKNTICPMWKK